MSIDTLLSYLQDEKISPDYLKKRYEILIGKALRGTPYYGKDSLFDLSNMKIINQMVLHSFEADIFDDNKIINSCMYDKQYQILLQSLDSDLYIDNPIIFDFDHIIDFKPLLIFNVNEICVHDDLDNYDHVSCEMIFKCTHENNALYVIFAIETCEGDEAVPHMKCNIIFSHDLKTVLSYSYTDEQIIGINNMIDNKIFNLKFPDCGERTEFINAAYEFTVYRKLFAGSYSGLINSFPINHDVYKIDTDDTESIVAYKTKMLKGYESFYKDNIVYQAMHELGPYSRGGMNSERGRGRGRGKDICGWNWSHGNSWSSSSSSHSSNSCSNNQ